MNVDHLMNIIPAKRKRGRPRKYKLDANGKRTNQRIDKDGNDILNHLILTPSPKKENYPNDLQIERI